MRAQTEEVDDGDVEQRMWREPAALLGRRTLDRSAEIG
jgi:hypothetical protein